MAQALSVVRMRRLVEGDASLVGDPHRGREIDDLLEETPLGWALEPAPRERIERRPPRRRLAASALSFLGHACVR